MNKTLDIEEHVSSYTETEKVILKRRSVRIFKNKQVPEYLIKRILETGRFAPSAGNCQPWKFIVLRDADLINSIVKTVVRLSKIMRSIVDYRRPGFFWLRPVAYLFTCLYRNMMHPVPFMALEYLIEGRFKVFHDAPTVIVILKDVRGVSNPDLDCGIAGQNMVLAAHSLGLGTCWVTFVGVALKYSKKWKKHLNIKYPYEFASSLAIGWPQGEPDGMVARQTHPVDWFENGEKRCLD